MKIFAREHDSLKRKDKIIVMANIMFLRLNFCAEEIYKTKTPLTDKFHLLKDR